MCWIQDKWATETEKVCHIGKVRAKKGELVDFLVIFYGLEFKHFKRLQTRYGFYIIYLFEVCVSDFISDGKWWKWKKNERKNANENMQIGLKIYHAKGWHVKDSTAEAAAALSHYFIRLIIIVSNLLDTLYNVYTSKVAAKL